MDRDYLSIQLADKGDAILVWINAKFQHVLMSQFWGLCICFIGPVSAFIPWNQQMAYVTVNHPKLNAAQDAEIWAVSLHDISFPAFYFTLQQSDVVQVQGLSHIRPEVPSAVTVFPSF